jgi:hypothetical protein
MTLIAEAHAKAHVNVAIYALQTALSLTPRSKHEELLDHIYNEIVHRCFGQFPATTQSVHARNGEALKQVQR